MAEMLRKTFTVESKAIDPEAGIYEAMISTESIDRDGDILLASGADVANYIRNPVVLFGHNYSEVEAVVGKTLRLEQIDGKGIKARWQFAPKEVSEDADRVRRLWAGGFLNATSVGFMPKSFQQRQSDDGQEVRGRVYDDWELLEFSIVPVPANQDALRLAAKSLGLSDDPEVSPADEPVAVQEPEPTAPAPDSPAAAELTEEELEALASGLLETANLIQEWMK